MLGTTTPPVYQGEARYILTSEFVFALGTPTPPVCHGEARHILTSEPCTPLSCSGVAILAVLLRPRCRSGFDGGWVVNHKQFAVGNAAVDDIPKRDAASDAIPQPECQFPAILVRF